MLSPPPCIYYIICFPLSPFIPLAPSAALCYNMRGVAVIAAHSGVSFFSPLPLRRLTHAEGGFFFFRGLRDGGIWYLWGIAEVECLAALKRRFRSFFRFVVLCTARSFVKSRQTHEKGAVSALNVLDDRFIVWDRKAQEGAF